MTCVKDFFMTDGGLAFKAGVEYEYEKDHRGKHWFKSEIDENHFMDAQLQEAFATQGEVSKSMNIQTRPAHRFEINGYWILVDPTMSEDFFKFIEEKMKDYFLEIPF